MKEFEGSSNILVADVDCIGSGKSKWPAAKNGKTEDVMVVVWTCNSCVFFFLKTKTRKNHIFEEYSIRYIYAAFPHTFNGLAKFFISKHTFCQSLFVKKLAQHEQFRCEEVGVRGYPTIKYGDPDDLQDGNPRGWWAEKGILRTLHIKFWTKRFINRLFGKLMIWWFDFLISWNA